MKSILGYPPPPLARIPCGQAVTHSPHAEQRSVKIGSGIAHGGRISSALPQKAPTIISLRLGVPVTGFDSPVIHPSRRQLEPYYCYGASAELTFVKKIPAPTIFTQKIA
jgi:hypothetical protein